MIGITGKARAGKDTAASFYRQEFGYEHLSFAAPMKKMAAALADESQFLFEHDVHKESEVDWLQVSRRRLMQLLGNEAIKPVFGNDIWIRHLMHRVDSWKLSKVVISDVRFDMEAQAIIDRGGYILRVVRPEAGLQGVAGSHASEAGVNPDLIDFDVENIGTVGEFRHELRKIAEFIEVHGARQ